MAGAQVQQRHREPRDPGSLWKVGPASCLGLPVGTQLCGRLGFGLGDPFWICDLQNCKMIHLVVCSHQVCGTLSQQPQEAVGYLWDLPPVTTSPPEPPSMIQQALLVATRSRCPPPSQYVKDKDSCLLAAKPWGQDRLSWDKHANMTHVTAKATGRHSRR